VTIVFYDSGPTGFINTYYSGPYSVGLSGSFANGTLWSADIDSTGGASITTSEDGSITGAWKGSDTATFVGTAFTEYVLTIDAPSIGVFGNVTFSSVSVSRCFQKSPHRTSETAVTDSFTAFSTPLPLRTQ
jgi:hypothetical protein